MSGFAWHLGTAVNHKEVRAVASMNQRTRLQCALHTTKYWGLLRVFPLPAPTLERAPSPLHHFVTPGGGLRTA